ncbi:MAG: hypothetical protein KDC95_09075 [Planctomycetes bacterium]|nr:hypothetical protein [Planctomycetota bacterium]
MATRLPRSETPHPRTRDLDRLGAAGLVDLLHACDLEVFDGVCVPNVLDALRDFSVLLTEAHRAGMRRVVLAGAGTSGRLAHLIAARHAASCQASGVQLVPWIAGGARALLHAVEGAEDDVVAIRHELAQHLDAQTIYVGISCGLSAPCVAAGVLEAHARGSTTVVFGTNDPATARRAPLTGLPGGFAQALELVDCVLAPDVGFEPLTGSSRMKGGTATWLCLDAVLHAFACALAPLVQGDCTREVLRDRIASRIERSRSLAEASFAGEGRTRRIVAIEAAAASIRGGGCLRVVGRGEPGLAAVLDASECQPTFGVEPDRVRAFAASPPRELYDEDVGLDAAREELERLDARDCLIVVREDGWTEDVATAARVVQIDCEEMLDAKLTLNAISTSAFVLAGKVFGNRMIDVALSNAKLFDRAVRIVADVAHVSEPEAKRSVVAVLHCQDEPSSEILELSVHEHLEHARLENVSRSGVVPRAVLHARGVRLGAAEAILSTHPVVRDAIDATALRDPESRRTPPGSRSS